MVDCMPFCGCHVSGPGYLVVALCLAHLDHILDMVFISLKGICLDALNKEGGGQLMFAKEGNDQSKATPMCFCCVRLNIQQRVSNP